MRNTSFRKLKSQARGLLEGNHASLALATFLMSLANLLLLYILSSVFPSTGSGFSFILNLACSILMNMIYFLLLAGLHLIYLQLVRGYTFRLNDLTFAFSHHPEPVAILAVAEFLLQEIPANLISWSLYRLFYAKELASLPLYVLLLAAAAILMVWIDQLFSVTLFVYCDAPHWSVVQIIKESWRLLRGNLIRLLLLKLSFIGMGLLCILSLGIGVLFVQPYLYTTQGLFYLKLREARAQS